MDQYLITFVLMMSDIASAINKALACRQPERDKYLKKLDDIQINLTKLSGKISKSWNHQPKRISRGG